MRLSESNIDKGALAYAAIKAIESSWLTLTTSSTAIQTIALHEAIWDQLGRIDLGASWVTSTHELPESRCRFPNHYSPTHEPHQSLHRRRSRHHVLHGQRISRLITLTSSQQNWLTSPLAAQRCYY